MPSKLIISDIENGRTLGAVLTARGFSRRLIIRLKRTKGGMTRNGAVIRTVDKIYAGEEILLRVQDDIALEPNGELKADILYESGEVIVFDKPPFMPVHPSIKHQGDTLGNLFAFKYNGLTFRPVNRLDRDTSGCVVIAKSQFAAGYLQQRVKKIYYAVCTGAPPAKGRLEFPIAREGDSIIKRQVSPEGRYAVTEYEIIDSNGKYSLCRVIPVTGRTHQIRVHFAHIGCPLAGDDMYGGSREDISRQALHCGEAMFTEPETGEEVCVFSDIPEDMKRLIHL